ncbi:MAG TPA: hypothetical protein PLM07_19110 [Candidatus Rifleibacterium sp.]|nr:hypothetical protein [Candidatus Rifleibacterium sp.]HPT47996.1 hypothetical protein [Candidatus Rifleibacterium sp.]
MTSFRWITTGEKQPENCVFELRVIVYDGSKKSYPCDVSMHAIGLFSSSEKAEAQMRLTIVSDTADDENDDMSYADCIHHFEILARPFDKCVVFNSECEKRVYDDLGCLMGVCLSDLAPFAGKKPEECQFLYQDDRFKKARHR